MSAKRKKKKGSEPVDAQKVHDTLGLKEDMTPMEAEDELELDPRVSAAVVRARVQLSGLDWCGVKEFDIVEELQGGRKRKRKREADSEANGADASSGDDSEGEGQRPLGRGKKPKTTINNEVCCVQVQDRFCMTGARVGKLPALHDSS